MTLKRVPIPQTVEQFGRAVKEKLDRLTGQHPNFPPIGHLKEGATDTAVVDKINQIAARMNEEDVPSGITTTQFAGNGGSISVGTGNIDGGLPESTYGGTTGLDGGTP
jgi:hypothetical protein